VLDFGDLWPYFTFFGMLLGAGIGFPIPEELPIVLAGAWAALESTEQTYGALRWLMLPTCILGVVISDGLLYGIGRKFGTRILDLKFFSKIVPPAKRAEIEENFHKHGIKVLLFARFLPGIRAPIFIMAGVMKLPLRRFLIADGIYAIPGVTLLFFLAWGFGQSFISLIEKFEEGVSNYVKPLLILIALTGVIIFLVYKFLRHPVSTGDPADVKVIEQLTHVPVIKQMTQIIEGKPPASTAPQLPEEKPADPPVTEPVKPLAVLPSDNPGDAGR
jgi:membrane protein DedA with SNARE-associated domain